MVNAAAATNSPETFGCIWAHLSASGRIDRKRQPGRSGPHDDRVHRRGTAIRRGVTQAPTVCAGRRSTAPPPVEPPPRPPRAARSRQPATILDLALDLPIMGKLILRTVGGTARLIESDCR
ncbi:hypothetical protein X961_5096 [Burkholderia pseudomallei MSHR5613]|nr:hypothetical protein X961_5096 [Burkholderia pseudomallei MSHR5613]